MSWAYTVSTPAVGDKITAAGFGTQVSGGHAEVQKALDATPGAPNGAPKTTLTTVAVGTSTIVASPASGRRVLKSLVLHAPTPGASATLVVAGTTVGVVDFATAAAFAADLTVPITSSETIQLTVTGSTVYATATWTDRTTTDLTRLGLLTTTSASDQTLVTGGAARTITSLLLAATGASATTATVKVGSGIVLSALPISSHGLVVLDTPIEVPAATAVTVAADGTNTLAAVAAGY